MCIRKSISLRENNCLALKCFDSYYEAGKISQPANDPEVTARASTRSEFRIIWSPWISASDLLACGLPDINVAGKIRPPELCGAREMTFARDRHCGIRDA
jgi:hypothetical protein